jgi:hypothetical protein
MHISKVLPGERETMRA